MSPENQVINRDVEIEGILNLIRESPAQPTGGISQDLNNLLACINASALLIGQQIKDGKGDPFGSLNLILSAVKIAGSLIGQPSLTGDMLESLLLVDSDKARREMRSVVFETLGYEVLGADRGADAMEVLGRENDNLDLVAYS